MVEDQKLREAYPPVSLKIIAACYQAYTGARV